MLKTYHGSCHCGAIGFEADIDLAAGTNKCNCSICTKRRNWNVLLKPDAFRLLQGENSLSSYAFGSMQGQWLFCSTCGCAPFSRGDVAEIGGAFVSVAVTCLDDASPTELAEAPVRIGDGRNNAWWQEPAERRHL